MISRSPTWKRAIPSVTISSRNILSRISSSRQLSFSTQIIGTKKFRFSVLHITGSIVIPPLSPTISIRMPERKSNIKAGKRHHSVLGFCSFFATLSAQKLRLFRMNSRSFIFSLSYSMSAELDSKYHFTEDLWVISHRAKISSPTATAASTMIEPNPKDTVARAAGSLVLPPICRIEERVVSKVSAAPCPENRRPRE